MAGSEARTRLPIFNVQLRRQVGIQHTMVQPTDLASPAKETTRSGHSVACSLQGRPRTSNRVCPGSKTGDSCSIGVFVAHRVSLLAALAASVLSSQSLSAAAAYGNFEHSAKVKTRNCSTWMVVPNPSE